MFTKSMFTKSLIQGYIESMKLGFRKAWDELPVNDKHSIIASIRQFADELEKGIEKDDNRL